MRTNPKEYIEEKNISSLFEELMAKLIHDMPQAPIPYLVMCLQKMYARDHPGYDARNTESNLELVGISVGPHIPVKNELPPIPGVEIPPPSRDPYYGIISPEKIKQEFENQKKIKHTGHQRVPTPPTDGARKLLTRRPHTPDGPRSRPSSASGTRRGSVHGGGESVHHHGSSKTKGPSGHVHQHRRQMSDDIEYATESSAARAAPVAGGETGFYSAFAGVELESEEESTNSDSQSDSEYESEVNVDQSSAAKQGEAMSDNIHDKGETTSFISAGDALEEKQKHTKSASSTSDEDSAAEIYEDPSELAEEGFLSTHSINKLRRTKGSAKPTYASKDGKSPSSSLAGHGVQQADFSISMCPNCSQLRISDKNTGILVQVEPEGEATILPSEPRDAGQSMDNPNEDEEEKSNLNESEEQNRQVAKSKNNEGEQGDSWAKVEVGEYENQETAQIVDDNEEDETGTGSNVHSPTEAPVTENDLQLESEYLPQERLRRRRSSVASALLYDKLSELENDPKARKPPKPENGDDVFTPIEHAANGFFDEDDGDSSMSSTPTEHNTDEYEDSEVEFPEF
eukprot:Nk52_evm36s554 gene=Nk52_evmTU36s554